MLHHGAKPDLPGSSISAAALTSKLHSSSCLEVAASRSSVATFDLLISHGANRETGNLLHLAAARSDDQRASMMSHLIALGYDVNATDDDRGNHSIGTPLHYAIMANSPSAVSFLLRKGADPHKPVGRCGSAYKMAELMGRDQCVNVMKQAPEAVHLR